MPALFALGDKVIKNPGMSYFLAFGSFAMLLMVDFQGSRLDRLRSQALLGLTCAMFVCLGTLVSQSTALATIVMFIVAFAVLFSGIVSSVIASATTPLLLSFILPVTVPGPASQIPERVAGWGIAAVVSLFAITFLWPSAVAYPDRGPRDRRLPCDRGADPGRDGVDHRGGTAELRGRLRAGARRRRTPRSTRSTSCSWVRPIARPA